MSISRKEDHKYLRLFDLMNVQKVHDDEQIINCEASFKSSQFSNLKAHHLASDTDNLELLLKI